MNLWPLCCPKIAQCGQIILRSVTHMISKGFLCALQKSCAPLFTLKSWEFMGVFYCAILVESYSVKSKSPSSRVCEPGFFLNELSGLMPWSDFLNPLGDLVAIIFLSLMLEWNLRPRQSLIELWQNSQWITLSLSARISWRQEEQMLWRQLGILKGVRSASNSSKHWLHLDSCVRLIWIINYSLLSRLLKKIVYKTDEVKIMTWSFLVLLSCYKLILKDKKTIIFYDLGSNVASIAKIVLLKKLSSWNID